MYWRLMDSVLKPRLQSVYALFRPFSIGIFLLDIWRHRVQQAGAKHRAAWSVSVRKGSAIVTMFSRLVLWFPFYMLLDFRVRIRHRAAVQNISSCSCPTGVNPCAVIRCMAVLTFTFTFTSLQMTCWHVLLKSSFSQSGEIIYFVVSSTHAHTLIWTAQ